MATITSTVNGVNAAKREAEPDQKVDVAEGGGLLRVAYDSYTFDAADELGVGGKLRMMKLPAGARIIDAEINAPASGATGIAVVGWEASADGAEVANNDALYAGADFDPGGGAVARLKMANDVAGYGKTLAGEVEVFIEGTEITADSGGDTWELYVYYTLD